jgi:hypothetical protein
MGSDGELGHFLRHSFFSAHRKRYESRPIYLPLASTKRSFVALVSIHRWAHDTLSRLLADHLLPERQRLESERSAWQQARAEGAERVGADARLESLGTLLDELADFITATTELSERGPAPARPDTPERERDARFEMVLGDGVRVNAAALWPLCEPLWPEPRRWWHELASRRGPKGCHFDWSATAARYFPTRVAAACARDPVVASAHRVLWREHPAVAHRWEERLRRERGAAFAIVEPEAAERRAGFVPEPAVAAAPRRRTVRAR